jgi:hypothetical protein
MSVGRNGCAVLERRIRLIWSGRGIVCGEAG